MLSVSAWNPESYGNEYDENELQQWAAIERLPTFEQITTALLDGQEQNGTSGIKAECEIQKFVY